MKFVCLLLFALLLGAAAAEPDASQPVASVADGRLLVAGVAGQGTLPVYLSTDWAHAQADVSRVLIFIPDASRDGDRVLRIARAARYAGGDAAGATMLVVPQFLAEVDLASHHLTPDVLHWTVSGWSAGEAAIGPSSISSFSAIDAILARLADDSIFPGLRRVVIAGHAAGAQLVQRYAVVGRGQAALERRGISIRYVIANAASYLWPSNERPDAAAVLQCAGFNRWPYGLDDAPKYVDTSEDLEARYIKRDVVYLLGESEQAASDQGCAAAVQGATPYARGMHQLFGLEYRHPNLVLHRILTVWGAANDAGSMFVSPCGTAALFDRPGCAAF